MLPTYYCQSFQNSPYIPYLHRDVSGLPSSLSSAPPGAHPLPALEESPAHMLLGLHQAQMDLLLPRRPKEELQDMISGS